MIYSKAFFNSNTCTAEYIATVTYAAQLTCSWAGYVPDKKTITYCTDQSVLWKMPLSFRERPAAPCMNHERGIRVGGSHLVVIVIVYCKTYHYHVPQKDCRAKNFVFVCLVSGFFDCAKLWSKGLKR